MEKNLDPNSKLRDLTISDLREIISEVVKETIQDIIEDREALSSSNYINSIKEAREEYKSGNFTNLDDILNV